MPKKPHPYQVQDKYFLLAKQKGYRARSAFKLLDIQKKFHLIKPGQMVVDLGAAPGSFMQVIAELVGMQGQVLGVDLQAMETFPQANMKTAQGDIFEKEVFFETLEKNGFQKVDGVTSDLAPKTSGVKDMDTGLSAELTDQAAYLAIQILKPGGYFVGKIFEGSEFQRVLRKVKRHFRTVNVFKPEACRDRSYETYIVAQGFLGKTKPEENLF
ncbi:RlmE family RNA methyltransferase [Candidatus Peregrinibacteria bacterium]|nr:MAG: RlmE family RNA methyltransferase [Candidatus Peregrinibacteria bacterium]